MEKNYWLNRWNTGEIGWHQNEVEPALISWASRLKNIRIFVPFCGKSLDLLWLKNNGFEVVGIELSSKACEEFFSENRIEFVKIENADFSVFESKNITIFNSDFFELTAEQLGVVGAVYDRAALIALPGKMRIQYAAHMLKLLKNSICEEKFEFLQIILTKSVKDKSGPPFSIELDEIEKYYGKILKKNILSQEKVEAKGPVGSETTESVILLKK